MALQMFNDVRTSGQLSDDDMSISPPIYQSANIGSWNRYRPLNINSLYSPGESQPTIGGTSSAYRSTWFLHLIPTTVELTSSRHSNSIRGASSVQKETENSSHTAVHFSPLRIYVTSATSTTTILLLLLLVM